MTDTEVPVDPASLRTRTNGNAADPDTATETEIARALRTARAAQPGWAATPATERAAALHAAAATLRAHAGELAATLERGTGRPAASGAEGVEAGAGTLVQYAELGPVHRGRTLRGGNDATDFMVPEPSGVVAALTPWNDPVAIACGLLGAALVTGNTVLHKPSERCPRTGARFGELLAGHLPEGVLQTLSGAGEVGAALAGAPEVDVVAHVGGTATGRSIAAAAARTGATVLLENGGNDPLLVDAGVDPGWAAEQAALGAFANAGQICVSVERIFVHREIAEPFLAALVSAAERWNADPQPLVDARQREHVHAHVSEAVAAGSRVLVGGEPGPGAHYPPTHS